jgi:hypothetical protein
VSTHPKHLDLAFDLGHSEGIVDIPPPNEFDSNFFTPLTMQPELHLSKLALAEGLKKEIWAKLGNSTARMSGSKCDSSWMGVYIPISGCFLLLLAV